jgi:3-deoxy-manno-octulosonate cytidylyltransferase (CMP-KDO synthetase)
MSVLVVVPARRDSERLPLKPLVDLGGVPMVVRTFRQAQEGLDRSGKRGAVVVATDCTEIAQTVESNGGKAIITSDLHVSGTSRCLEAAEKWQAQSSDTLSWVLNVQGDEPLVNPDHVAVLLNSPGPLATLYTPLSSKSDLEDRSVCYVVPDAQSRALYFSRWPIPYQRTEHAPVRYKHLGVYGYTPHVLNHIAALDPADNERAESLEQLRWLHHGYPILLHEVGEAHNGVDTWEDVLRVRAFLAGRP